MALTDTGSLYTNPTLQWAYGRCPMYCNMDRAVLDLTGWDFWDDLDSCLDAPEFYPVGSLFGKGEYYRSFVYRGYNVNEHAEKTALTKRLLDRIKAELEYED